MKRTVEGVDGSISIAFSFLFSFNTLPVPLFPIVYLFSSDIRGSSGGGGRQHTPVPPFPEYAPAYGPYDFWLRDDLIEINGALVGGLLSCNRIKEEGSFMN